jgi:hypothetical protein
VGDISKVCFDDKELDTKICGLMSTSRKSKASRKKDIILIKNWYPNERIFFGIADRSFRLG